MPTSPGPPRASISLTTATSLTVANMIGTGVFTSLGFQVVDISSGFSLLMLWLIGGVFALCGALSYGELAAAIRRSGGEFTFLSRIYHPAIGFLVGWISITVGFAAPIALAAMAFGRYFARVVETASPLVVSCLVVVAVTLAHLRDLRFGSLFQNFFTLFKVVLILVFLAAVFFVEEPASLSFAPTSADLGVLISAPFAISLLFVMYAYTGWNAATYVIGEVEDAAHNVPRALVIGTLLVAVFYVALNWMFLYTTPIAALAGQIEVGHVVAARVFGPVGGRWMSAMLCLALVSAISAMTWAGPRVSQMMGEDLTLFRALATTNRVGIPVAAILVQTAIVLILLVTSTFQAVLIYAQFTLTASSCLAVLGVFYLRFREPDLPRPYRTWGYPITPLLFVIISLFTMGYALTQQPVESLAGLATVVAGLPLYFISRRMESSS